MKSQIIILYHCLHCGAVHPSEPEAAPPECCGETMVKAAVDTPQEPERGTPQLNTPHAEADAQDAPRKPR